MSVCVFHFFWMKIYIYIYIDCYLAIKVKRSSFVCLFCNLIDLKKYISFKNTIMRLNLNMHLGIYFVHFFSKKNALNTIFPNGKWFTCLLCWGLFLLFNFFQVFYKVETNYKRKLPKKPKKKIWKMHISKLKPEVEEQQSETKKNVIQKTMKTCKKHTYNCAFFITQRRLEANL